jgi:hypothetical protein
MSRRLYLALALLASGLASAQDAAITGQWAIDGLPVADQVELTIHRRSSSFAASPLPR